MTSASPARGRPDRQFPGGRAELHDSVRQHGPALSEGGNGFGHDFADEPRLVAVDFNRSGIPRLCLFVPFHSLGDSRG